MDTTRVWTGTGDDGTTGRYYGGRMAKNGPEAEAIGSVDETQAAIGVARALVEVGSEEHELLTRWARDLYILMAELATGEENLHKLVDGKSRVDRPMVEALERHCDEFGRRFPPLKDFVVPGATPVVAALDSARVTARRAERAAVTVSRSCSMVVPYLNRLSSALWAMARWVEGDAEISRKR